MIDLTKKTKAKTTTITQSKEAKNVRDNVSGSGAFKRVRALTLPQLKQATNQTVYIKFMSEMRVSTVKPKDGEDFATIANVVNLEDGQESIFIIPAVLKGVIEQDLENDYVDKCFEITKLSKPNGKRYNQYEIYEIDA